MRPLRASVSRWLLAAALLRVDGAAAQAPAVQEPTRILVLFTHDPNAPGVAGFAAELRSVVSEGVGAQVVFFDELLDLDRFPEPERRPQLARYLAEKYVGFRFDAIVAAGAPALGFAAEHATVLFPGVPIVYGLAFEPVVDFGALPEHVTGRRQPLPFAETLAIARSLQPDAERVVLVGGSAPLDSLLFSVALRDLTPLLGDLELETLREWTYESLLASLRRLPPRTIAILSSFRRDQRGVQFNSGDLIASFTRVASAPVYGIARNWVGDGIVGGSVMDFGDDGLRTGELLVRVLTRAPRDPLPPPQVAATPLVVDWRQLDRWRLSESRLPAGTQVLFRPPTLWEGYWGPILAVLGVFAAQALLIARLVLERARRLRAQRSLEQQAAYERMMAALTTDAVRHAPGDATRGMEDALARVARFAGARTATLVVADDGAGGAPLRLRWSTPRQGVGSGGGGARLEVPLISEDRRYGVLELERSGDAPWPAHLVARLEAAGDIIAASLARARAARALEQSAGEVAHIARVATVGELAAAVSHELRQPLTAIHANAQAGARLLARKPPEVHESRVIFDEIARESVRASDVMDHIRLLLRRQAPTSTPVDLNGICRATAQLLEVESGRRGVHLRLALEPLLPRATGDAVQLQQVVMNLTLNAIDAAAASKGSREVVVGTAFSGPHVELFVRDSGPGLPAEAHRLFEPFFSTKTSGLGMGLAIVRTIVERHHGSVKGENDPKGGAVFSVTLPARDGIVDLLETLHGGGDDGPAESSRYGAPGEPTAAT
jgi:signal transduction histidine kinase